MSKPTDNVYTNLFEPNIGYIWKQDLQTEIMLLRIAVCSFSYAFEIKEGIYVKVGERSLRGGITG